MSKTIGSARSYVPPQRTPNGADITTAGSARECLAIDVAGSIRSGRVIDMLAKLVTRHGAPRHLRSDNGPEFVSKALLSWLVKAKIDTALSDPGKP